MFLRKLFSNDNKATWVVIDLIIVIIGVYCAFLIQNFAEDNKTQKERDRVLTALKYEMEIFRYRMHETTLGMQALEADLRSIKDKGSYTSFADYRFIEPQYDYQTISYALNLQNTEVVDFLLYDQLQSLFVEIKKIEHAERLITETSRRYHSIPPQLQKSAPAYAVIDTENKDNFNRFITLVGDRADISGRIAEASAVAMPIINERLGSRKARDIERQIIVDNSDKAQNEDEAVRLGELFFPNFSDAEIRELYRASVSDSTAN